MDASQFATGRIDVTIVFIDITIYRDVRPEDFAAADALSCASEPEKGPQHFLPNAESIHPESKP